LDVEGQGAGAQKSPGCPGLYNLEKKENYFLFALFLELFLEAFLAAFFLGAAFFEDFLEPFLAAFLAVAILF